MPFMGYNILQLLGEGLKNSESLNNLTLMLN